MQHLLLSNGGDHVRYHRHDDDKHHHHHVDTVIPIPLTTLISSPLPQQSNAVEQYHGSRNDSFPIRLYRLLQVDDVSSMISWDPNGRSFHIQNVTKFILDVLPRYFHVTKLTSFRRQLHLYGFRQITLASSNNNLCSQQQQNRGSYYHTFFLRDHPDLCHFIGVRQRRYYGHGASHQITILYGISSSHSISSSLSSSSSQSSKTTNHTMTSSIVSTGKDGVMTSPTCHDIRKNDHDCFGMIPFRPLSRKPKLPTGIMTKKNFIST